MVRPARSSGGTRALSPRQWQLVALLARGLSSAQIALVLGVTKMSVESYISTVLPKVDAASRIELGAWYTAHADEAPDEVKTWLTALDEAD